MRQPVSDLSTYLLKKTLCACTGARATDQDAGLPPVEGTAALRRLLIASLTPVEQQMVDKTQTKATEAANDVYQTKVSTCSLVFLHAAAPSRACSWAICSCGLCLLLLAITAVQPGSNHPKSMGCIDVCPLPCQEKGSTPIAPFSARSKHNCKRPYWKQCPLAAAAAMQAIANHMQA